MSAVTLLQFKKLIYKTFVNVFRKYARVVCIGTLNNKAKNLSLCSSYKRKRLVQIRGTFLNGVEEWGMDGRYYAVSYQA